MNKNEEKKKSFNVGIKKTPKINTKEELCALSKEELVDRMLSLEAHNLQLKNIITKSSLQNHRNKTRKLSETNDNKVNKKQRRFDFTKCEFRHVLLKLYYLGWDHHGYVIQEDTTNTIEYYLFEALLKTCLIKSREDSNYHRCGRTDKGVSSFSQVISIDVRSKLSKDNSNLNEEIDYCQVLNRVLPDTIQCIAWCPVETGFSARFECKYRTYKYFFPKGSLNVQKMLAGSEYMLGGHDFRNLCKMDVANGVTEFMRNIDSINIEPCEADFDEKSPNSVYSMFVLTIKSKGFLWHQIRCIMAVLFLIGEGKEEPEVIQELLDVSKNPRKPDYSMANETPLNLFHCEYDFDENWNWDHETLSVVVKNLQSQWTITNVKSTMMKTMLSELEKMLVTAEQSATTTLNSANDFVNVLNQDNKSKRYVCLMERPKCDSLEDKIAHYLKRRRLEIKPEDNQDFHQ